MEWLKRTTICCFLLLSGLAGQFCWFHQAYWSCFIPRVGQLEWLGLSLHELFLPDASWASKTSWCTGSGPHTASLLSHLLVKASHKATPKKQTPLFNRKSYKATFTAKEFMAMKHLSWLWTRPWGYSLPFCSLYLADHKQVNKLKRSENAMNTPSRERGATLFF